MHITKKILLLIIVLISIVFSSCSSLHAELFKQDNQELADMRLKQITESIESKDKEQLKTLFSVNALREANDIDGQIEYLMLFYQGKIVSKDNAIEGEASNDHGAKINEIIANYEIKTDVDNYVIYFIDVLKDTENPDNVGLYMLEIKKLKDKNDDALEWGGEVKCAGIYCPEETENEDDIVSDD